MEKAKSAKTNLLIISIIYSVLFVASIPGLVLSAVHKVTALMIICIVILVLGFYTLPVVWIKFGDVCTVYHVVYIIYTERLYDSEQIALQLQIEKKTVCNAIRTAIQKGYLTNFIFDGNVLTPNEKKKALAAKKCPNCGANLTAANGKYVCNYCGFETGEL